MDKDMTSFVEKNRWWVLTTNMTQVRGTRITQSFGYTDVIKVADAITLLDWLAESNKINDAYCEIVASHDLLAACEQLRDQCYERESERADQSNEIERLSGALAACKARVKWLEEGRTFCDMDRRVPSWQYNNWLAREPGEA